MAESPLVQKEIDAFHALQKLAAERARAETQTESGQRFDSEAVANQLQAALQKAKKVRDTEVESTKAQHRQARETILTQFQADYQAAEAEYAATREAISTQEAEDREAAEKEHEDARWQVQAFVDASQEKMSKRVIQTEADINATVDLLHALQDDAAILLQEYRKFTDAPDAEVTVTPSSPTSHAFNAFQERLAEVDALLLQMKNLALPNFLKPVHYVWPFIALWLLAVLIAYVMLGGLVGPLVSTFAVVVLALVARVVLLASAKAQVRALYQPLRQKLAEAEEAGRQAEEWGKATTAGQAAEIEARQQRDLRLAEEKYKKRMAEIEASRDLDTRRAEEKYPRLMADIKARRDAGLRQADEKYPKRVSTIETKYGEYTQQLKERHEAQHGESRRAHAEAWNSLSSRWRQGIDQFRSAVEEINRESENLFLDWKGHDQNGWQPPEVPPPGIRFGEFQVDLSKVENGIPKDERLKDVGPTQFTMPAILPFPDRGSLLIRASEEGRDKAIEVLQAAMLRYLTSIPPGKVRFTIIDPVGLGENFAAFMHLADYSELLVTNRIWTETPHIDQRLADLSAHMENVIQKYLRNEFETIEDYNVHAGEVAEPFRVLVIANFPANFSEGAARRLNSIVTSGARCGVYTLMSVDTKQALPGGIQLKDLEPHCVNLTWKDGQLQWKDTDFARFPLQLDAPPDPERFSLILHDVGERARNANKVEVPFDFIAPKPEKYWTWDSRKGISVPLGRAATKLQHLALGKGTSQHVLIAGKTGSGKSTLLHALITNAALMYSPDEIELYLIDFKKGVEFKVYAAMQLPHAKVIAVESEREFGLSVLQRLDVELKYRGEKYREYGVQDLNGYRELKGVPPMPRILFIVDEFQEFFVEDDKIAQDTSLLLDRMVRQGRAFGIHVHLGSQTLSGAYSLARSTLGQMAVRIALQCSEADAHLILSEDNSAARLLTRPGEAIYNDANGMVEGNNLFQVVLLSEERRDYYLKQIFELSRRRNRPAPAQIVFEGNIAADATKNHLLNDLLNAPSWPESTKSAQAWLGDAIAIKDPTAVVIRPQSGCNLLIVGQNDEATLGILSMAMIGLAAQYRPFDPARPAGGARFYLLDGSPVDSPFAGTLARLSNVIPHPIRDVAWRELAAVMGEIAAEVERRREADSGDAPAIFLIIYDLQRFRDLRKSDDDFGFSSSYGGEEKVDPPSKLLGNIMKEGPAVGVHTIIWCDSLNNLNRTFDRSAMREFENRILFQMSANDSSTLIDSPAASRLGPNRALFSSEELGRHEKFRPYGFPSDEWLDMVRTKLSGRMALAAPDKATSTDPGTPDGNGATSEEVNGSAAPGPDGSGVYAAKTDLPTDI